MLKKLKRQWYLHVMLIPSIILVFIFSYIPLAGLVIAFEKYTPKGGFLSPWVGWDNFRFIFSQPNFISSIWNTFFIAIAKLLGGAFVSICFALLLNELFNTKLRRVFQTLIYLPNFISWIIIAGVFVDILARDGIINIFLGKLGIEPIPFLSDPSVFPWTLIFSDIWKGFGFGTVVYLAALTSIDPGLYESAMLDGASRWQQVLHVTLPQLMPTIILMLILSLGNVLNAGFDQVYNLYSPIVYSTGDIIDTFVYRLGFKQAQYSVAAAVGLFKSAVSGVMVISSYVLADKVAGYRIF